MKSSIIFWLVSVLILSIAIDSLNWWNQNKCIQSSSKKRNSKKELTALKRKFKLENSAKRKKDIITIREKEKELNLIHLLEAKKRAQWQDSLLLLEVKDPTSDSRVIHQHEMNICIILPWDPLPLLGLKLHLLLEIKRYFVLIKKK